MKNLIKHKIFVGTFLSTYFSFFFITVCLSLAKPIYMDLLDLNKPFGLVGFSFYGFPFVYFYEGCFNFGTYHLEGLISNILFASLISALVGVFISFAWSKLGYPLLSKISSPEFRAKWYL